MQPLRAQEVAPTPGSGPAPSLQACRTQVAIVRALLDELEDLYHRPFQPELALQLADEVGVLAGELRAAADRLRADSSGCVAECSR